MCASALRCVQQHSVRRLACCVAVLTCTAVVRFLRVQWGLPGLLACGGTDGTVRVWNASTGACVYTLGGGSGGGAAVTRLEWSDGWLVAGFRDGAVRVWQWIVAAAPPAAAATPPAPVPA